MMMIIIIITIIIKTSRLPVAQKVSIMAGWGPKAAGPQLRRQQKATSIMGDGKAPHISEIKAAAT